MDTKTKVERAFRRIEAITDAEYMIGPLSDADDVLEDIIEDVNLRKSGTTELILKLWNNCSDRKTFEELFEAITDVSFPHFLDKIIKNTKDEGELIRIRDEAEDQAIRTALDRKHDAWFEEMRDLCVS